MAQQQSLSSRITTQPVAQTRPNTANVDVVKLDEGAGFGARTDWGEGTFRAVEISSRKGMFFGLHTDWGRGIDNALQETGPDEGAYFGLHTDWGKSR